MDYLADLLSFIRRAAHAHISIRIPRLHWQDEAVANAVHPTASRHQVSSPTYVIPKACCGPHLSVGVLAALHWLHPTRPRLSATAWPKPICCVRSCWKEPRAGFTVVRRVYSRKGEIYPHTDWQPSPGVHPDPGTNEGIPRFWHTRDQQQEEEKKRRQDRLPDSNNILVHAPRLSRLLQGQRPGPPSKTPDHSLSNRLLAAGSQHSVIQEPDETRQFTDDPSARSQRQAWIWSSFPLPITTLDRR